MRHRLLSAFKQLLTIFGAQVSERTLHNIQMIVNYMKLGSWMRRSGYDLVPKVRDRKSVFDEVSSLIRDEHVLYLEFGVFEGASMRYWANALKNPDAILHGFDSFTGLPEDFDAQYPKGAFDLGGGIPVIDDDRVSFYQGWFEETLPSYSVPGHERLVIVLDADLYSSTIFALRQLRSHIVPGTFIYFDELSRTEHEPRAFDEFARESGLRFRPVAAERSLNTAFFECIGVSTTQDGSSDIQGSD